MFLFLFSLLAKQIHEITDSTFDTVATGKWVLVFQADWCPYCNQFKSVVQELNNKLKGYEIGTVNIDKESALNSRFLIQKLPSIFVLNNGTTVEVLPDFNVDKMMDKIKDISGRTPMFIQPFGILGYALFYLGFFGKTMLGAVKYLQNYLPTWAIIIIGIVIFSLTFLALLVVSAKPVKEKVDEKKKKQ